MAITHPTSENLLATVYENRTRAEIIEKGCDNLEVAAKALAALEARNAELEAQLAAKPVADAVTTPVQVPWDLPLKVMPKDQDSYTGAHAANSRREIFASIDVKDCEIAAQIINNYAAQVAEVERLREELAYIRADKGKVNLNELPKGKPSKALFDDDDKPEASGDWRNCRAVAEMDSHLCMNPDSATIARWLGVLNALPDIIDAECAKAVAQAVEEAWAKEQNDGQ